MRKFSLLLLTTLCISLSASAQKNIILEQVRTFSMLGPIMNYWTLPSTRSTFINQLTDQLLNKKNAVLSDTTIRIIPINNLKDKGTESIYFTTADTTTQHLYVDIYEYDPVTFFYYQPEYIHDSLLFKRTRSVFQVGLLFVDHKKNVISNDGLTICVGQGSGNGFGIIAGNLAITPKGFTDMLNLSIGKLLDTANNSALIEVKVAPAFYADNFILPEIGKYPVLQTKSQKDIYSYQYNGKSEMIRMGDKFYEELIAKGKKKNIPDNSPIENVITATGNINSSDFVQLRQECRDVIRDKNYTIKLINEVNPNFNYLSEADLFTHFLSGPVHVLLKEKDTIARFSIYKNIGMPEKKIFLSKISNGYDSSSVVNINASSATRIVFCEYKVEGYLGDQPFSILCTDRNSLKEIYLDEKRIAVAKGNFLPERIAIFDASLDIEKLNQLMMIAFTKFYQ